MPELHRWLSLTAVEVKTWMNNDIPHETTDVITYPCHDLINPLRAKFFRGNINIYLHFVSFLHIDTTQVFEIFPQIRQEPTYST